MSYTEDIENISSNCINTRSAYLTISMGTVNVTHLTFPTIYTDMRKTFRVTCVSIA